MYVLNEYMEFGVDTPYIATYNFKLVFHLLFSTIYSSILAKFLGFYLHLASGTSVDFQGFDVKAGSKGKEAFRRPLRVTRHTCSQLLLCWRYSLYTIPLWCPLCTTGKPKAVSAWCLCVKEMYRCGCWMHGRRTRWADRSYEIRWGERSMERGGKAERITQEWKTWPQLMCCALASRNVGSFDLRMGLRFME